MDYKLINPNITGEFNPITTESSEIMAANVLWERMAKHIKGPIKNFAFSIKSDDDNVYSYKVNEKKQKNGFIKYTIKPIKNKYPKNMDSFVEFENNMNGGFKCDSYCNNQPIRSIKYNPCLYDLYPVCVPTFRNVPYIEILTFTYDPSDLY